MAQCKLAKALISHAEALLSTRHLAGDRRKCPWIEILNLNLLNPELRDALIESGNNPSRFFVRLN